MSTFQYHKDESICALATPWAQSALAVIRCSGPEILKDLEDLFISSRPLGEWDANRMVYGKIIDPENGSVLDEAMAVVFRAPRSYTGQDSVEFTCHGSLPGIESILKLMHRKGIREASPGEFTYRAFMHGKMDLTRAEAVQEIVSARTAEAQSLALNRLSGVISAEINGIKDLILTITAALSLALDYPEDEVEAPEVDTRGVEEAMERIRTMIDSYKRGKLYQEGVRLALAGRTNAGKSSLFNLILREERSIVSQIHGTTRDYLEATVTLKGIPVRVFDTAGLRESDDPIEQEGIRRSRQIVENSQVVLLVLDSSQGLHPEEEAFLREYGEKVIPLWNKCDQLSEETQLPDLKNSLHLSALTGEGFPLLEKSICDYIFRETGDSGPSVVIDSLRQKELLQRALDGLERFLKGLQEDLPLDILSEDIRDSLDALGEITGEVSSADILEAMFSRFCVGK